MAAVFSLDDTGSDRFAEELKPGTRLLLGQFTVDSFLSAGGFGITYLARDSLDRRVVVKECFPASVCRRSGTSVSARSVQRQGEFQSIVALFLQEAHNLSQLDHPNIVKVHQVFQDNDTAYMAMDCIDGPDFLATLEGTAPRLTPDQIVHALTRLLDALGYVHSLGFLHRDISPDNILLDRSRGEPVLIDFGAARKDVTRKSRALSGLRVVKDGYSPQEFYISGSKQAPCSDLYALAASFCHLVSGETPKTSQERLSAIANGMGDPQRPLLGRVAGYPPAFLRAIDSAMSIFPRDRLQSAAEWQELLAAPGSGVVVRPFGAVEARLPDDPEPEGAPPDLPLPVVAPPRLSVATFAGRMAGFGKLRGRQAANGKTDGAKPRLMPQRQTRAVQLPFIVDPVEAGLILDRLPWSPDWVERGGRIVSVNNQPVEGARDLATLLAGKTNLARRSRVTVALGYVPPDGGPVRALVQTLPVVLELRLQNGLSFQMQQTPTGVRTLVTAAPKAGEEGLMPGDILLSCLLTGEVLGTATALSEILKREGANQIATLGFAVQRQAQVTTGHVRIDAMDAT
ncbi:MAG: hypothetical protein B7Z31_03050 [Rhodobacterales bacterium 12-65-15]|nr:MAG: hypothetical protein B7Z31_03050 [Rhodobacterales bacterium 12-65-15]